MHKHRIGFWLGILIFISVLCYGHTEQGTTPAMKTAAIAALMATWWMTEAIPLAATALLPLVLFPTMGVMSGQDTADHYINYVIFLFIGGFLIALAMEKWHLHRRIALFIIGRIGNSPSRLLLGFMLASALLSMWISNTATTLMMLTIVLAIIKEKENLFGTEKVHKLSVALLLGIAYASTIGGMSTLIGTPPNLSFVRILEMTVPNSPEISFGRWFVVAAPISITLFIACFFTIKKTLLNKADDVKVTAEIIAAETQALGKIKAEEIVVLIVFISTALLWMFRADLTLGAVVIPGWVQLLPFPTLIDDGTVAVAMALILFMVPASVMALSEKNSHQTILDMHIFKKIPWNIILLFGGGFALANGIQTSGLSALIASSLTSVDNVGTSHIMLLATTTVTALTELTSNTATTEITLPVLAAAAQGLGLSPLLLMIPATLAASCAFMLPVATPPNAIIFASGRVRIAEMVKVGLILNVIAVVTIVAVCRLMITLVFPA